MGYLVFDHGARTCAKASRRAEAVGDGSDQHIDFGRLRMTLSVSGLGQGGLKPYGNIVEFSQTTPRSPHRAERYPFVEHEPEFVLGFELDLIDARR
jgi:hypothetical protein